MCWHRLSVLGKDLRLRTFNLEKNDSHYQFSSNNINSEYVSRLLVHTNFEFNFEEFGQCPFDSTNELPRYLCSA